MAVNTVKVNLNGQNYDLSFNSSSGKWEATITAPSTTSWNETDNKYGLTITATDDAGNKTSKDRTDAILGNDLTLRVLEKIKPIVSITNPSSGARVITSKPTITFTLRDSHSGIDITSLDLKIDGGSKITHNSSGMTCTPASGGYDCSYIPPTALSEGSHTVYVNVMDNDGNLSTTASSTFNVDTVPPALNINSPTKDLITNKPALNVTGSTNDETSSPVEVTIMLNGTDQGVVSITSGNFSKAITLTEGLNTVIIKAVDAAGLESSVTRTVTLDTKAPVISAVTVTPNPVDSGKSLVITVTVSDL